jgi:hypothetical protein
VQGCGDCSVQFELKEGRNISWNFWAIQNPHLNIKFAWAEGHCNFFVVYIHGYIVQSLVRCVREAGDNMLKTDLAGTYIES